MAERDSTRQRPLAHRRWKATSLLDEILAETKMTPGDEGYDVAEAGVQAFIAELVAPKREGEKVDKALVDAMIAEIDQQALAARSTRSSTTRRSRSSSPPGAG